jgi:PAS domain-containing protein
MSYTQEPIVTKFLANLMMSDLFIPHGHCYLWNTQLVGLHLEARVAKRTQELATSMQQAADLTDRLTLAIDSARLGTFDWNLVTEKVAWNAYHMALLGYAPAATEASSSRRAGRFAKSQGSSPTI